MNIIILTVLLTLLGITLVAYFVWLGVMSCKLIKFKKDQIHYNNNFEDSINNLYNNIEQNSDSNINELNIRTEDIHNRINKIEKNIDSRVDKIHNIIDKYYAETDTRIDNLNMMTQPPKKGCCNNK